MDVRPKRSGGRSAIHRGRCGAFSPLERGVRDFGSIRGKAFPSICLSCLLIRLYGFAIFGSMEIEAAHQQIRSIVEGCLGNTPVIILGSGASAAYGIHTMDALADEIIRQVGASQEATKQSEDWQVFLSEIQKTSNLERSLETIERNDTLTKLIAKVTWALICEKDYDVYKKLIGGDLHLALSDTISHLSNGTGPVNYTKIITTNYDRLAEYACDFVDDEYREYLHYTGFGYGLIRRPDDKFRTAIQNAQRRTLNRSEHPDIRKIIPVEILKVHGSLDWFEHDDGTTIGLPAFKDCSGGLIPAIITPGKRKFERTHVHPYSMIIEAARLALDNASSYFAIGFGFRDNHIHDNLEKKLKHQMRTKPFVVLAKTLTQETRSFFLENDKLGNFALFEENDEGGSAIHFRNGSGGAAHSIKHVRKLWDLKEFNRTFINGEEL